MEEIKMGWCCKSLNIILDEQKWDDSDKKELFSYIESEYENNAAAITYDNNNLYIEELYYDPDEVIRDIVQKYPDKWFNAEANTQSEGSGEYQDINYSYDGNLKNVKSELYTDIDIAKKEGEYADNLRIVIDWKTDEKQMSDVESLGNKVLDVFYERLSEQVLSKEAWVNAMECDDNLNKKNSRRVLFYHYPVTDNNLFDFKDENILLQILEDVENDGFEIEICYSYIDTESDRQYDLTYKKKKKARVSKEDKGFEYIEWMYY